MKTSTKIAIIIAVCAIIIGTLILLGAAIAMKFNFNNLSTVNHVTNTHRVEEAFDDISIECVECDVVLVPSLDGSCKVVCNETDKVTHLVSVRGGTLTIERNDTSKWYERIGMGLHGGKLDVTVYLPNTGYGTLNVTNVAGDIEISKEFSFTDADIRSTSGDIMLMANIENELNVKTVSGDITLSDIECRAACVKSVSGDMKLSRLQAANSIQCESTSGDVRLTDCDAESLLIKTVSGDVSGSLRTGKRFTTHTVSGSVHVPDSASGGECEIKTTSGNIRITISE